jgi:hypothetical protein
MLKIIRSKETSQIAMVTGYDKPAGILVIKRRNM